MSDTPSPAATPEQNWVSKGVVTYVNVQNGIGHLLLENGVLALFFLDAAPKIDGMTRVYVGDRFEATLKPFQPEVMDRSNRNRRFQSYEGQFLTAFVCKKMRRLNPDEPLTSPEQAEEPEPHLPLLVHEVIPASLVLLGYNVETARGVFYKASDNPYDPNSWIEFSFNGEHWRELFSSYGFDQETFEEHYLLNAPFHEALLWRDSEGKLHFLNTHLADDAIPTIYAEDNPRFYSGVIQNFGRRGSSGGRGFGFVNCNDGSLSDAMLHIQTLKNNRFPLPQNDDFGQMNDVPVIYTVVDSPRGPRVWNIRPQEDVTYPIDRSWRVAENERAIASATGRLDEVHRSIHGTVRSTNEYGRSYIAPDDGTGDVVAYQYSTRRPLIPGERVRFHRNKYGGRVIGSVDFLTEQDDISPDQQVEGPHLPPLRGNRPRGNEGSDPR